jgi:hypothetical protein
MAGTTDEVICSCTHLFLSLVSWWGMDMETGVHFVFKLYYEMGERRRWCSFPLVWSVFVGEEKQTDEEEERSG